MQEFNGSVKGGTTFTGRVTNYRLCPDLPTVNGRQQISLVVICRKVNKEPFVNLTPCLTKSTNTLFIKVIVQGRVKRKGAVVSFIPDDKSQEPFVIYEKVNGRRNRPTLVTLTASDSFQEAEVMDNGNGDSLWEGVSLTKVTGSTPLPEQVKNAKPIIAPKTPSRITTMSKALESLVLKTAPTIPTTTTEEKPTRAYVSKHKVVPISGSGKELGGYFGKTLTTEGAQEVVYAS